MLFHAPPNYDSARVKCPRLVCKPCFIHYRMRPEQRVVENWHTARHEPEIEAGNKRLA